MWKHYQLSKLVNQGNNFVIFEEFFDDARKSFIMLIYILPVLGKLLLKCNEIT